MVKFDSMSRVEIYKLKSGGLQEVIAECRLEGDQAVCSGDEKFVERLSRDGILDKSTQPPTKVFPSNGRRFLESLKGHFNSGYLVASEVLEDTTE